MWPLTQAKRGQDTITPPVPLQTKKDATRPGEPPTYVYTQRREPHVGPTFLASPGDQYYHDFDNHPGALNASAMQDAPDPIRQSYFWDAGNKIRPWAHMPKVSKLNLAAINQMGMAEFCIGKLKQPRSTPMYEGGQLPSVQRFNIAEGKSGTFGSQYEVSGTPSTPPLVLANGMSYTQSLDGHPY